MDEREKLVKLGTEALYGVSIVTSLKDAERIARAVLDACLPAYEAAVRAEYEQVGETCMSCGWVGRPDDCGCGGDMRHVPVYRRVRGGNE